MGGLLAGYVAQLARTRTRYLVLVGSAGMEATPGTREPLQSWRRLATEQEKREIHRRNLGILMIHDPRKIDDLAVYIQSQNAGRSRVRGKHLAQPMALSHCLPGFAGPSWPGSGASTMPPPGPISPSGSNGCDNFSRRRPSTSSAAPAIGCSTRRMSRSIGCCAHW